RRGAAVERLAETEHRIEQRLRVFDPDAGGAYRRQYEAIGALVFGGDVFAPGAVAEFAAGEQRPQHVADVAVAVGEARGETVDQRRGRLVGDEMLGQREGDVARRRRAL